MGKDSRVFEDGQILSELSGGDCHGRDDRNRSTSHPERSEHPEEVGRLADQLEGGEDDGEKPWGGGGRGGEGGGEQEQHHPKEVESILKVQGLSVVEQLLKAGECEDGWEEN